MKNWIKGLESKTLKKENIKESEILSVIPFELVETWDNFMRGKTCPILENGDHGIYSCDLHQFLNAIR